MPNRPRPPRHIPPEPGNEPRSLRRKASRVRGLRVSSRRGLTIIEIVVSMAVLLTGIVAIVSFFPRNLHQNQRISDTSVAVYLAQMKAEEIRRDNSGEITLIEEIQAMQAPSPPITFPFEPRFAYSLSGVSLRDPDGPRGIARVIVRYSPNFRPEQEILYELAFDK